LVLNLAFYSLRSSTGELLKPVSWGHIKIRYTVFCTRFIDESAYGKSMICRYIERMMKDVKKNAADVVEMYSKFYENFKCVCSFRIKKLF
jgi:hypothetical protein